MTLITWLVVFEFIVGFFLLIWLVRRAVKHVKHSPAETALQQHLAELEAAKVKKERELADKVTSSKERSKK
ncbi:MAG: hypothetical protein U0491_03170 [Candidatus Saccharimonadales bacterium]